MLGKLLKFISGKQKRHACPNCGYMVKESHFDQNKKPKEVIFTHNLRTDCKYLSNKCPSCGYLMSIRIPKFRYKEPQK